jgi:deoxyribonuclease IV
MDKLLFGTGGVPHSTTKPGSAAGIERIAELGLDCMELEFVRGVHMGKETALQVAEAAKKYKIKLTAHAPYFINLHASDMEKIEGSKYHILQTARIASLCGAESVNFHAAGYEGTPPEEVYDVVKKNFSDVLKQIRKEKINLWIRPEVMGKAGQFGTLDEVIRLSSEFEGVLPTIDFAHWHARTGKYNTYEEFSEILETLEKRLSRRALEDMHMHISGIKYGVKGELSHLNFDEADFNYMDLVKALKDHNARGFAICESPNLETDALILKNTYRSLK